MRARKRGVFDEKNWCRLIADYIKESGDSDEFSRSIYGAGAGAGASAGKYGNEGGSEGDSLYSNDGSSDIDSQRLQQRQRHSEREHLTSRLQLLVICHLEKLSLEQGTWLKYARLVP